MIVAELRRQGPQNDQLVLMLEHDNQQRIDLDVMMDQIDRNHVWIRRTFWPVILFVAAVFALIEWKLH